MRSRECIAILLLIGASAFGCASAPTSPPDWLPDANDVGSGAHGGWIEIDCATPHNKQEIDGELLAIQHDHVYVLNGDAVRSVPIDSVRNARLTWYDSHGSDVAELTVLGTLSTISNGAFLVFTAPMWMIGGSIAANSRYHDPIIMSPAHAWDEIRPYARFPQGLPPGFVPNAPPVIAKTVTEPVVEPEPPPPTPQSRTSGGTQFGFALGAGVTKYDVDNDSKGQGVLTGVNVSNKWATAGVRMALGFSDYNSNVVDLGLLLGVRGRFHALALALRAGPAMWGVSFGDLVDFHGSFAAQGELVVYLWPSIGIGALVAYNDNDYIDFTVVTLGIVIGPR
jgi:hypothetical protein